MMRGGKSYKKFKSNSAHDGDSKRLIQSDDFEGGIYAKVTNMLGSGRLIAIGQDKKIYHCVIRGKLYKKVWIIKDDYLVIVPRSFEKRNCADVVHKLNEKEVDESEVRGIFSCINDDTRDDNLFEKNEEENDSQFDFDKEINNL